MATVTIQGLPPRHDGFHLDPPLYYPPTLQSQGASSDKTTPNFPFYRPPPKVKLPRNTEKVDEEAPTTDQAEKLSQAAVQAIKEDTSSDRAQILDTRPVFELSNQVHVLGFTQEAKFVAHAVTTVPNIPAVRILAHSPRALRKWGEEGRGIRLFDAKGQEVSSRTVPCPEYIGYGRGGYRLEYGLKESDYLDNIIVSTASWAVLPTLNAIRRRIDRRTTICLLHPGLGVMEMLNEEVFQDPASRPNFVLGHGGHKLSKTTSGQIYAVRHDLRGRMTLYGVPRNDGPDIGKVTDSHFAMQQSQHLVKLLSATDTLGAGGVPLEVFLHRKLPGMIFSSLADTISVILGCRFNQVRRDRHAMSLWESLFNETIGIISAFPELQSSPTLAHLTVEPFRKLLQKKLAFKGDSYSPWISWIRYGHSPPIDFINGYFVKRAQELGVDHKINSLAIFMVKARMAARRNELKNDIPLGYTPYMLDGDRIGGGQAEEDAELDDDLDFDF